MTPILGRVVLVLLCAAFVFGFYRVAVKIRKNIAEGIEEDNSLMRGFLACCYLGILFFVAIGLITLVVPVDLLIPAK